MPARSVNRSQLLLVRSLRGPLDGANEEKIVEIGMLEKNILKLWLPSCKPTYLLKHFCMFKSKEPTHFPTVPLWSYKLVSLKKMIPIL